MDEDCVCEGEEDVAQHQKDKPYDPSIPAWSIHVGRPFRVMESGRNWFLLTVENG